MYRASLSGGHDFSRPARRGTSGPALAAAVSRFSRHICSASVRLGELDNRKWTNFQNRATTTRQLLRGASRSRPATASRREVVERARAHPCAAASRVRMLPAGCGAGDAGGGLRARPPFRAHSVSPVAGAPLGAPGGMRGSGERGGNPSLRGEGKRGACNRAISSAPTAPAPPQGSALESQVLIRNSRQKFRLHRHFSRIAMSDRRQAADARTRRARFAGVEGRWLKIVRSDYKGD